MSLTSLEFVENNVNPSNKQNEGEFAYFILGRSKLKAGTFWVLIAFLLLDWTLYCVYV